MEICSFFICFLIRKEESKIFWPLLFLRKKIKTSKRARLKRLSRKLSYLLPNS